MNEEPQSTTSVIPESLPPAPPLPLNPIQQKNTKRHTVLLLVIVLFVVLAIGAAAFLAFKKIAPKEQAGSPENSSQTASITPANIDTSSIEAAYDSFSASGVSEFTPEKKQETIGSLKELLAGFDASQEFFNDAPSLLISLGIAQLYSQDKANYDGYRNELYLMSVQYLPKLPDGISDKFYQTPESDDNVVKVFEKYTDKTLSERMRTTLQSSGLEAEVKRSLKLSDADKLTDYTAIVFDFDNASSRQKEFAKEHYMFGAEPKMWVEEVDSKIYILFAKNYGSDFVENPNGSERTSVLHEFIHAQSPFNRGHLGRAIEERRAEKFSGDKSAYYDAKQLFIYTETFSGISALDLLDQYPTSPTNFYTQLYAKFGIKAANSIVTSWPSAYLSDASEAVTKTIKLTGGMDSAVKESLVIGRKNSADMEKRTKERAEKLFSVFKTKDKVLSDINANLGSAYGMPSAAAQMKEFIQKNY